MDAAQRWTSSDHSVATSSHRSNCGGESLEFIYCGEERAGNLFATSRNILLPHLDANALWLVRLSDDVVTDVHLQSNLKSIFFQTPIGPWNGNELWVYMILICNAGLLLANSALEGYAKRTAPPHLAQPRSSFQMFKPTGAFDGKSITSTLV